MATTADQVVVELVARTGAYDAAVAGSATKFEAAASRTNAAAGSVEVSLARSANATRNLGRQVSDVGVGLASGQNPFLILAQQAPQVADALADTGGKAARLATFFAGPWGAALLAAGSIAGIFAGKLLASADASDTHKKASDALTESIEALNQITGISNRVHSEEIRLSRAAAESNLAEAQSIRDKARAKIADAQASLAASQKPLGIGEEDQAFGRAVAGVISERQIKSATKALAEADAKITSLKSSIRGAGVAESLDRIAEKTDKSTAATGRYNREIDRLTQLRVRDKISQDQFDQAALRAKTTLDSTQESIKGATKARSAEAKSAREAAAAERELEASLASLQSRFDPAADGARRLAEAFSDINKLEVAGKLSDVQAIALRSAVIMKDYADRAKEAAAAGKEFLDSSGIGRDIARGGDEFGRQFAENETRKDSAFELKEADIQSQKDKIQSLADFYESAFKGGTGSIFDTFKEQGLKVIALLLAQFTASQFGGGGGGFNLGSAFSSAIGSVFGGGRASGGPVAAGKLYRVNEGGQGVEGFRPAGSGEIIPLGRMNRGRGGGVTINQTTVVQANGSVTPEDFAQRIIAVTRQETGRTLSAGLNAGRQALPGQQARYDALGTT